ncbi:MAG: hypothetical protein QG604_977 [Candidatus Dependentiae bacterium]|nr:hypothetical protein [Candidatus Dependentiae bacterium]
MQSPTHQPKALPIPLKALFGYAPFSKPRYSPCGTYYTFLAPTPAGAPTLWIERIDNSPEPARPLLRSKQRPLSNYTWLKTSKHIVFLEDVDGNEMSHLYLCDITTGTVINLSPFPGARVTPHYFLSEKHPDKILFQTNNRVASQYDVIQYCLTTGAWTTVAQNPGNVLRWYADNNLKIRARMSCAASDRIALETRATTADEWVTRVTWDSSDTFMSRPLFFSPCGTHFYFATTTHTNTNLLQRLDLQTGAITEIFNDPDYDIYHEASLSDMLDKTPPYTTTLWASDGSLAGFSYYKERLTWKFFTLDSTTTPPTLLKMLTAPEWESWIETRDATAIIVGRCSSSNPTEFWRYDRQTDLLVFLGCTRPELHHYVRATTTSLTTTTPDGVVIHGYLTMPTTPTGQPTPLVLKIHGGPWTRDVIGFAPEIQMLASRGYACLQVNYRGSTGYGKKFCEISRKQLGAVMVDDVIHMMQHVLAAYPLDPTRIAYMGRSYGGFSALSVGWRYQELFKAIIAQVPVTNLALFLDNCPPHWSLFTHFMGYRMGNPRDPEELDLLTIQSPLAHAHLAKLPTLISYGGADTRVTPIHVERYMKVMHQSDDNQIIYFPNEGHWTVREENLFFQWHNTMDFIEKNLKQN